MITEPHKFGSLVRKSLGNSNPMDSLFDDSILNMTLDSQVLIYGPSDLIETKTSIQSERAT